MKDIEQWKPIPAFEGRYEISSFGRVRGLPRTITYKDGRVGKVQGKPLRGTIGNNGYVHISLDSTHRYLVHRLVAIAFLGKPEDGFIVNHRDGNKTNNHISNLEWASYKENNNHARTSGLNSQDNELCNLHKYQDGLVMAVLILHAAEKFSQREIANLVGITQPHVSEIIAGKTRAKLKHIFDALHKKEK